jgi:non-canonical purine NTP pyrophosphatase (RdgB/HAM1 family)
MKNIKNRSAHFQSVIAFSSPEEQPTCFHGKVKGKISLQERGTSGFGYDPIFEPTKGDGRTFAEMTTTEKNQYSHRETKILNTCVPSAFRELSEKRKHAEKRKGDVTSNKTRNQETPSMV